MSLESTAPVVAPPPSGSETTTAAPEASSETTSRYEGFSSPDAPEPDEANQVEQTQEQQPEQTAEPEATADESAEAAQTEEPDPWAGYEDYDFDGTTVKIPSDLKPFLMKDADYRKKTAAVAERGRELDAREAQITERQKLSDNEVDAQLALISVGSQLKKFENVNWAQERAKAADDPIAQSQLSVAWQEYQELQSIHNEGKAYLDNAARQRTEQAKQETATRLAATKAFAEKNIKGWTPDLDAKITNWAVEQGFTRDTLLQAYNPQVYYVLHKAFQWDQSLKRQQSAKPNPPVQQTVKPTPSVTAKANVAPSFDAETSSMDDYARNWAARQKRR